MDLLGLKALPQEAQPIIEALFVRVNALEAMAVSDINNIADKVIAALEPQVKGVVEAVNTITLTINASVEEVTALARRIDGATLSIKLGPEVPA